MKRLEGPLDSDDKWFWLSLLINSELNPQDYMKSLNERIKKRLGPKYYNFKTEKKSPMR